MTDTRVGDHMVLSGDRRFYPFDPRPEDVRIEDIAHGLANLCRFNGRTTEFYSVAQHSVLVAEFVARTNPELAIYGLLHDAAEAYLGDIITPVKRALRVVLGEHNWYSFQEIEEGVHSVILDALGVDDLDTDGIVAEADELALATEARDLLEGATWDGLVEPDPVRVMPMAPYYARLSFLSKFTACMKAVQS